MGDEVADKMWIETTWKVRHLPTEPTFQNTSGTLTTIDHAFSNGSSEYLSSVIECPY